MKKVKSFLLRNAHVVTAFALLLSTSTGLGRHCRTFFYQPEVPQD